MIKGLWYTGANLDIDLQTGIVQSDADSVSVFARFPDGTVNEYTGEVVDFTSIRFRLPAADNTQPGEIALQASAVVGGLAQNPGKVETIWINAMFAVEP